MELFLAQEMVVVHHRCQSEVNKVAMKPQSAQAKAAVDNCHLVGFEKNRNVTCASFL